MSKGILVYAFQNNSINYIDQAIFLAKRVKTYLDLPTTIITDESITNSSFDNIIFCEKPKKQNKNFIKNKSIERHPWYNAGRHSAFEHTPYDQTLILDTDYVICNSLLSKAFESASDLMMYSDRVNFLSNKNYKIPYISETGCKFYWASCVFFTKTKKTKIFFDLVKHIQENYFYYVNIYQLDGSMFRNDYAFSIAAHIMSNFSNNKIIDELPGTHYIADAKDTLIAIKDNKLQFELTKDNNPYPALTTGLNVHVFNKFSLDAVIGEYHG